VTLLATLRSSFLSLIIKATISLTGNYHFSHYNPQIPHALAGQAKVFIGYEEQDIVGFHHYQY